MHTPHITEVEISGLEAMLAGTLCLMSAYAHAPCTQHQDLMALKIVSNLKCLQCQAALSGEFRQVLCKVTAAWQQHRLLQTPALDTPLSAMEAQLWHQQPDAVQ
jgi:hypothetical protein